MVDDHLQLLRFPSSTSLLCFGVLTVPHRYNRGRPLLVYHWIDYPGIDQWPEDPSMSSFHQRCTCLPSPIRFLITRPRPVISFSGDVAHDMKRGQLVFVRWLECRCRPRNALVNEQGTLDAICCSKCDMLNWRYVVHPSIWYVDSLDN